MTRTSEGARFRCGRMALPLVLAATAAPAGAQPLAALEADPELDLLAEMSFEDLMTVEVTSVAGVEERWFETPSAIYVITPEDVRRSGSQTIAEALRMVPGMFVGHAASSIWQIGPRGFTGGAITSTKNLVLIDGRVVYDPLFSGTFWDVQDVLLEDLDRIEVVRGPGATLWGANAVNGVINITTRSARETQGLYLTGGVGTWLEGMAGARYGGQLSDDAWYRVWGRWLDFDSFESVGGSDLDDDWSVGRMGFRIDGEGDDAAYTLDGGIYRSTTLGERQTFALPPPGSSGAFTGDGKVGGAHLLGRITRETGPGSGWALQAYYDRTEREQAARLEVLRDTFDLDFRHHFDWGDDRQSFVWGSRYTFTTDEVRNSPVVAFDPLSRDLHTFSGFVQNTSEIVDDRLFAMVGTKIEHNDHTGIEVQPSARLWWTPSERQTVWAAVSRAVRVPSRLEEDALIILGYEDEGVLRGGPATGVFAPVGVAGNEDLDAEELIAYELGHRVRVTPDLTFDTALFYHDYDELITITGSRAGGVWNNVGAGESYGVEAVAIWQVSSDWRVEGSYSYVGVHVREPLLEPHENVTPHHQAQLRSYLDVTEDFELNGALYYVDRIPSGADSYLRLDLGVTWRPTDNFELALWGQNLLDPEHEEIGRDVPRGVFLQGTLRF